MNLSHSRSSGLVIVFLATIAWAASGILITWIVDWSGITPVSLAFWRDLVTFISLLVMVILFKPSLLKVRRGDIAWLLAMGLISVAGLHVIWNINVLWNGAALATITQANAPIFVMVMAWLFWREPFTKRKIGAISLAILGTVLVASVDTLDAAQLTLSGLLIGLTSAFSYSLYSIFGKKLRGAYNPWTVMLYSFGFASLALLPFQLNSYIPSVVTTPVLLSFAALVIVPTILGYGLYMIGLGRLPASVTAVIATAEIPLAAIYAYFALGERLSLGQIFGAILIICGVILVSIPGRKNSVSANNIMT